MNDRATYVVSFWIENTGPYLRSVAMTPAEHEQINALIEKARLDERIQDAVIVPLSPAMSFEDYLQEAEILREDG